MSFSDARTVTILGSTGSIGCSTVDLLLSAQSATPGRFAVRALVGGRNVALLAEQARKLGAECAVIHDETLGAELERLLDGTGIACGAGREAVIAAAAMPADWTMAAITGAAGLEPVLASVRNGGTLALANKEALVCAGDVMLRAVKEAGATLLPVDSEHNAIFQSLTGFPMSSVEKIVLTASGGPFREASLEAMRAATPEVALRHPTWSMGAKISIDSATMANKGLEVIEAARIFGVTDAEIDVLVHPQSVVHGLVQFRDGSLIAQCGVADMRVPIASTLAWPERMQTNAGRLDLASLSRLDFQAPDPVRFPALGLARQALRAGGAAPAVFSAANEIAVEAFLTRRIGFLDIADVIDATLQSLGNNPPVDDLAAVLHWDAQARRLAEGHVRGKPAPGHRDTVAGALQDA